LADRVDLSCGFRDLVEEQLVGLIEILTKALSISIMRLSTAASSLSISFRLLHSLPDVNERDGI
jgi:hypothetical protein